MTMHQFDAAKTLQDIRNYRTICKRKAYQQSRLQKYRAEVVALRKQGGSFREIAMWLKKDKHCKVTHTTIMRYLKSLPELNLTTTKETKRDEETNHA